MKLHCREGWVAVYQMSTVTAQRVLSWACQQWTMRKTSSFSSQHWNSINGPTHSWMCSSHKPDSNDLNEFKQTVVKKKKRKRMPILHSGFAFWMACFEKQTNICFKSNIQKVYLISSIKTGMKIPWSLTGFIHTVDSHYSWQLHCIKSPWTLK